MADVHARLTQIEELVRSAKSVPLSSSCMVDRKELLAALSELGSLLPSELTEAKGLLSDKDEVVEEGRREAAEIVAAAHRERAKLIARTEIAAAAKAEAERLVSEAQANAAATKADVDDYVDTKLANFEVALQRTIAAVEKGRQKLRGREVHSELEQAEPEESQV